MKPDSILEVQAKSCTDNLAPTTINNNCISSINISTPFKASLLCKIMFSL